MRYRYDYRGKPSQSEVRSFHEKAHRRRDLAAWDARWHALTPPARSYFLNSARFPDQNRPARPAPLTVSPDTLLPGAIKELADAGLVEIQAAASRGSPDRIVARAELSDFLARVRMLNRRHLLDGDRPTELEKYVDQAFFTDWLLEEMSGVIRGAGIQEYLRLDIGLRRYVTSHRWPAWVLRALNDPLAEQVVKVLEEAGGTVALAELPGRIEGGDPDRVRSAVEELISQLVLFEDLQPETLDIVVGFLPAVREGLARDGRPRERPSLVVCERPAEIGPDESAIVNDLRAFLLEVASQPPRLRQDTSLFQREIGRFTACLDPLPSWLLGLLRWSDEGRLGQGMAWALTLGLVENVAEGGQLRLRLTAEGHRWLSSRLDEQYARAYSLLNEIPKRDGNSPVHWRLFACGPVSSYYGGLSDSRFLGENLRVQRVEERNRISEYYWNLRPEDLQALRTALDRAFAALEPGVFYRLDSVGRHLAFGEHNPVNLGLPSERVAVSQDDRPVPPLDELREEAGRSLVAAFVCRRLVPLGCLRTAIDSEGQVCIAREPRLDAYFGREVAASDLAPAPDAAARVVVQPDFSVILIGRDPTAAAELAPFCERAAARGGRGATILKITRESVVRAVAQGLEPAEIAGRLRRHASHEVPANVMHEVRAWSSWVRRVTPATLTVLRCPDPEAADRIMGALKSHAERLNDTLVAIDQKLTAAERNKLRAHGIITVESPPASARMAEEVIPDEPW